MTGQEDPLAASFFKYALRDVCGAHAVINADTVLEHSPIDVSVNKTDSTLSGRGGGGQLFPESVYNAAKQRPDGMTSPTFLSTQLSSNAATTATTTTTSSATTELPPPIPTGTDKPPVSDNVWARNAYLSLPIDELMERCINLIDELEAHDVDTLTHAQDTRTTTSTTSSLSGEPLVEPEKLLKKTGAATVSPFLAMPKDPSSTKPALTSQELVDRVLAVASNSTYPSIDRSPLSHTGPFSLLTPHPITPSTTTAAPSAPSNTTNSGNVKGTTGAVKTQRAIHDGLLLPVQVIVSGFRSIRHPHTRMLSIMLLVRFGIQCSDDIILHRIVPSLLYAVEDAYPQVRATAVRALCTLLSTVNRVDMIESNIFPQYIFPVLNTKIVKDPEIIVRIAFAESIPRFAEAAKRFLDQTHTALQQKAQAATDNDTTLTTTTTSTTTASPIKSSKENKEGRENASSAATAATPSVKDRQNRMKEFVPLVQFQYTSKLKALHDTVSACYLCGFYF